MRCLALLLALATPTAAIAGDFPVSAVYGTPRGCALFNAGGVDAVTSGGGPPPGNKKGGGRKEGLFVLPQGGSRGGVFFGPGDAQKQGGFPPAPLLPPPEETK